MGEEFRRSVEEFVTKLNSLLDHSIDVGGRFDAALSRGGARAVLEVCADADVQSVGVALVRSHDDPENPSLFLRVRYIVEMDQTDGHLRVVSSLVGLWADVTGGQKRPRPLVRVEYDRSQLRRGRAAAHVHLHANSPELAWMYGSSRSACARSARAALSCRRAPVPADAGGVPAVPGQGEPLQRLEGWLEAEADPVARGVGTTAGPGDGPAVPRRGGRRARDAGLPRHGPGGRQVRRLRGLGSPAGHSIDPSIIGVCV